MLKVFISSVMELADERETAKYAIKDLYFEPVMWEDFDPESNAPPDVYRRKIIESDIVIFILGGTITKPVVEEYNTAREFGKPILIFFKEGKMDKHLRDFINKIKNEVTCKNSKNVKELEEFIKRGLSTTIELEFREAISVTKSREEHYKMAINIINRTKKRLYLIERTPVLLFGPRYYWYEKEFHAALDNFAKSTLRNKDRICMCLYCVQDTKEEIQRGKNFDMVKNNLQKYKKLEEKSEGRFVISSISHYYGSFMVGDNDCSIWFKGTENAISIYRKNYVKMADILIEVFHRLLGGMSKNYSTLVMELLNV